MIAIILFIFQLLHSVCWDLVFSAYLLINKYLQDCLGELIEISYHMFISCFQLISINSSLKKLTLFYLL